MPLYDYRCKKCGHVLEVRHGFDETHSDPCPDCGGQLQRVFNPAPIVFKGSGFYVNDSRKKSAPKDKPAETTTASESKTEAAGDSKTETTSPPPASKTGEKLKPKKEPAA